MRNLFLLLLIGLSVGCNQQFHERHINESKEYIINLKEKGALIVRLRNEQKKMNALLKKGYIEWAEDVKEKAEEENKATIAAFNEKFNFCPVYFIFEQNSLDIRNKETRKGVFLNKNLQIDKTIECAEEFILTAEYGVTQPDTARFDGSTRTYEGENGKVLEKSGYKEIFNKVTGLLIKSDHFVQLHRPFPYYVKKHTAIVLSRNYAEMVKLLNRNLHTFYKEQK
ncbi:MAG: hypothetical protein ACI9XO_000384 [Paraglaciecola sp.]|jgi:hypothetical protein